MALTPITVDELRDRLDVLAVVGRYTRLTKAGTEYRGLCPFHDDHKPSLDVNERKGVWTCRVENIGGSVFDFVMRAENLDFREAAELLANDLGCTLAQGGSPEQADQRSRLYDLNRRAAELYERALWQSKGGETARAYLLERGISEPTAKRFRLGYAPAGWDKLSEKLARDGVDLREAEAAGLLKARERGGGYYDRFRHRLMFPILDRQGRVVAFGGRVLDPADEPKYLNSAESPVFSKGRLLYQAPGRAERLADGVLVVEGYMDVIGLAEHGLDHAVATLGTALTREHLRLLQRLTSKVVLCYDADAAGERATDRAAALFADEGLDGRILRLPDGLDPDELVRRDGAEAFRALAAAAPDLIEYRLGVALERAGNDPHSRTEAIRETVRELVADIGDEIRQAAVVRRVADWWSAGSADLQQTLERTLARDLERHRRRQRPRRDESEPYQGRRSREYYAEREFLAHLLRDAGSAEAVRGAVDPAWLTDPACRQVYQAWLELPEPSSNALLAVLDADGRALVAKVLCGTFDQGDSLARSVAELRLGGLAARVAGLRGQRAELPDSDERALALQREIQSLDRQIEEARRGLMLAQPGGLR